MACVCLYISKFFTVKKLSYFLYFRYSILFPDISILIGIMTQVTDTTTNIRMQ